MGKREVTVKVLLDDTDLKRGTASIDRLGQAIKNVGTSGNEIKKVEDAATAAGSGLDALRSAAGPIAAILTGIAAAAATGAAVVVRMAQEISHLAKEFADYANVIGQAQSKSGLAAQTLSALKIEVERTGGSFDNLVSGLENFQKTIGNAANGSKNAQEKLNRLGIDGSKAAVNLDAAFKQTLKTIYSLPPGVGRTNAAMDAFGESGSKLLPMIDQFHGDIDGLVKKMTELGVVLSDEDVKAAQRFNEAFSEIQIQVRGLAYTFGREFMDPVSDILHEFNNLLKENKGGIKEWAESSANILTDLIDHWKRLSSAVNQYRLDANNATPLSWSSGLKGVDEAIFGKQLSDFVAKHPMGGNELGETSRLMIEEMNRRGAELRKNRAFGSAGFDPYLAASEIGKTKGLQKEPKASKPQLTDAQKQAQELTRMLTDLNLQVQFFGQRSEEASIKQRLLKMGIFDVNKAASEQAIALGKQLDALAATAEKTKQAAEAQKAFDDAMNAIKSTGQDEQTRAGGTLQELQQQLSVKRELTDVEKQSIANIQERIIAQHQYEREAKSDEQISKLIQELRVQQNLTLEIYKQIEAEQKKIAAQNAGQGLIEELDNQIQQLNVELGISAELSTADATAKELQKGVYDKLSEKTRAIIEAKAAEVDALKQAAEAQAEARRRYDETVQSVRGFLEILTESGRTMKERLGDAFKYIADKFRQMLLDMAAQWLTSKIFKSFFGGQTGGGTGGSSSGSFSLGNIFGGGSSGGGFGGIGATGPFNPGYFSGGGTGSSSGGGFTVNPDGTISLGPQSIGNTIGLRGGGTFSTGGGSRLAGTLGLIGTGAGILGGAIGGRVGGVISGAGQGLALGAAIGSIIPGIGTVIGAAVGAIAGGLIGLFGGDKNRKQDKKENVPALRQGFVDAFKQLNDILSGIRSLKIDPDEAISQASAIRAEMQSGFGISFLSKKYKKQAASEIQQNLSRADSIINEIRSAAEIARGAADRSKRILPEFAGGHYFADFFRPNGLIPGSFDGADNILAMISRGEMVINPRQQSMVRALAGFDVFAGAGIPNYPNASTSPKLATGGIAGTGLALASVTPQINVQPNFTLELHGVHVEDAVDAYLVSDKGVRTQINVQKRINTQKRTSS
jgi:hypothetical protein